MAAKQKNFSDLLMDKGYQTKLFYKTIPDVFTYSILQNDSNCFEKALYYIPTIWVLVNLDP